MFIFDPEKAASADRWRGWKYGLKFKLRPVSSTDYRACEKKARENEEVIANPEKYQETRDRYVYDLMFEDWNVNGPGKQKLPLIPENKFALCNAMPGLSLWARTHSDRIGEEVFLITEKELGNLKTGPVGSKIGPEDLAAEDAKTSDN